MGLAGIFLAYRVYLAGPRPDESGTLWRWSRNGYYVDDLYGNTIVLPGKLSAAWMAFFVDAKIVDGAVNGTGIVVRWIGDRMRPLQTGLVRNYGVWVLLGTVGLLIYFLSRGGF